MLNMRRKPIGRNGPHDREKQGFTLTEVAIVLGIVGLILGAIWVAAAAVYTNLRTSKVSTELLTAVQNVRAMYATAGTVDPGANMSGFGVQGGTGLTYVDGGIFPNDMLNGVGNTATAAQDPWDGYVNIEAATNIIANDSFQISFDRIPKSACINIITSATGVGKDPGLIGVSSAATGAVPAPTNNTAMPVPASTADNVLCAAATQSIGFTFTLK